MKETLQHKNAFEYYYKKGDKRSYQDTAMKFNVSKSTIRNWGVAFDWQDRVQQRDIENAKRLEEKTDSSVVAEKAKLVSITKGVINKFVDNLKSGKVTVDTVQDYERAAKMLLSLLGEETGEQKVSIKIKLPGDLDGD